MRSAQSRWYAAAALGIALAAAGGWYRARQSSLAPAATGERAGDTAAPSETLQEENARLRREVASLKAQIHNPATRLSLGEAAPGTSAAFPEVAAMPVEDLLAKAQAALKAGDADAFVDAFDALMAAGEGAYPGLIALIQDIGEDWSIFRSAKGREAGQRFHRNLIIRAPRLGGLLDAILLRDGKRDQATQFALTLFQQGTPSGLPRERQIERLLALLSGPMDDAGRGHQLRWMTANVLAAQLKAVEALPALEKLYLEAPEGERDILLRAWPASGPECTASLRRLLDRSLDSRDRSTMIRNLGRIEGVEANEILWTIAQRRDNASDREAALAALATRPENLDRIVQQEMKNPQTTSQQRERLLWSLMQSGQSDKAAKQRLWELYDNDPALRDDLLKGFLGYQDPRAKQMLGDALRSGRVSDTMARHLEMLDTALLRERASTLKAMASNPQASLEARVGSYDALARVDRPAATEALLNGFAGLPEVDRINVLLQVGSGADEATMARLRRLAESDPSPKVKEATKAFDNP